MKLEVGMYVRTKDFGIQKITWFDHEEPIMSNNYTALKNAIKSSFNIIDLIEVGDYVNGIEIEVIGQQDVDSTVTEWVAFGDIDIYGNNFLHKICNINIKSIVTKEQFKSMEYIVGDK